MRRFDVDSENLRIRLPPRLPRQAGASLHGFWMIAVAALLVSVAAAAPAARQSSPLVQVADVPLGGNTTRLDYESLDPARHLLFIAHLGDSAVIVFDTQAQRVVTRIAGVSHVHGVLAVPELGTVYASATGTNEVVAIDEGTFR